MEYSPDLKKMDTGEVVRDLVNWIDGTDPGWRAREPTTMRELLIRANLYFEQVARRPCIPEEDFRTPLDDSVATVIHEHAS